MVLTKLRKAWQKYSFSRMSFDDAREVLVQWVENARKTETPICCAKLEKMGFAYIDRGFHASTFKSACGRFVLKVNFTYDEAYRRFIDLALNRQDNPHYPRIYYSHQSPEFQAVLMEPLRPMRADLPQWQEAKYLQEQVCFGIMPRNPEGSAHFTQLVWDMWSLFSQDAVREDLSGRNIMVRHQAGSMQLVVTDPVCSGVSSSW